MSYGVELSSRAQAKLNAMPIDHIVAVENFLDLLSRNPASMSRGAVSPPHPPGGMIGEFDLEDGDAPYHFVVNFRYSQDETRLVIIDLGRYLMGRGD